MSEETKLDLESIKGRRAAITGGTWEAAYGGIYKDGKPEVTEWFVRREDDDVSIAADILDPDTCQPNEANAEFIAHAPSDIDALLDYIERLEVKLDSVYNAKPQTTKTE